MRVLRTILLCCLLAAAIPLNAADPPGKHKKGSDEGARRSTQNVAEAKNPSIQARFTFSAQERSILQSRTQELYGDRHKHKGGRTSLPPGLSKKVARGHKLPPGWQKKCIPGEIMPAVMYEQCHPLPPELAVHLPPAPEPTITVTIGGKIVRLLNATREILDVFDLKL